ncbi:DUF2931 family protein [Marinobacter sp. ST-43]|uniref:DUF2931 family protein n=1 Tax=Marinobacter sp. ST-43 TaxID=3050453 RepID=UPI0026DF3ADF|nr:DUF2931 family protein [Marinobacter sp. ST-43]
MSQKLLLVLLLLTLYGCSSRSLESEPLWYFSLATPKHYDVWVEHLQFERSGERSWYHPAGSMSCCWKGPFGPAGIAGRMDLFPDYVAIQWFSFAEQKFYQRIIKVPRAWQDRMLEPALLQTELHGDVMKPRNFIMFGLAPGGEVVVWMMNQIGNEVELARFQANELDLDPDIYRVNTEEYLEQHGGFLDQHGIPTVGW